MKSLSTLIILAQYTHGCPKKSTLLIVDDAIARGLGKLEI